MFQRFGSFQICNSKSVSIVSGQLRRLLCIHLTAVHKLLACVCVCVCLSSIKIEFNAYVHLVFFVRAISDFRIIEFPNVTLSSVFDWSSSAISNQSSFLAFCHFQLLLLHTAYNTIYSTTTNHTNSEIQWEEPVDSSDAALLALLNTIYHTNPHSV